MFSRKTAAVSLAAICLTFAVLAPTSSHGASPSLVAQERAATAHDFVARELRVWQNRMSLNDWDLRVQIVRATELEPKTLGNIHWDTDTHQATIDVLSSYDYTLSTPEMLKDMEMTIVHEMVHLQLATLPRSEATRVEEEHAVNRIAGALMALSKH